MSYKKKTVTISKDGKEAEVLPSSVPLYVRKGWKAYQADAKKAGVRLSEDRQTVTALTAPDNGDSKTTDKKE